MKKIKVQLSNSMVDSHGESMSLEALESGRDQTNSRIMSSHSEHNFKNPPIARFSEAFIEKINGVHVLYGYCEIFEQDDIGKENPLGDRSISLHTPEHGIDILYDRSYELNGMVDDIKALQEIVAPGRRPTFELKKSFEPISTLTILIAGGTFIAGAFAGGFFNKAGEDFWDTFKGIVAKNKIIGEEEKHYQFIVLFENEYYRTEVIIILEEPNLPDIEFIKSHIEKTATQKVIEYYTNNIRAGRITFTYNNYSFTHCYSVYKDGTPFDIADIESYKRILSAKLREI